ncbi:MAG: hypothetical protein IJM74_06490, partial [Bacteroidales bacterium]|nr:hypothetical protein [Bacteroidales bacterium]
MNEECLICGAPLEYLEQDTLMECVLCHKQEASKTRCRNGHYVCNECHMAGMDSIIALCMAETSTDPIEILEKMMSQPFCHMHGPEHHVLVGAALLTAYNNALPDSSHIELGEALTEVMSRGKNVPGGACGYMGACGAAISTGIFIYPRQWKNNRVINHENAMQLNQFIEKMIAEIWQVIAQMDKEN